MGLSCSCDDFDKGDYDHWWEPGGRRLPPAGTRCCECAAPLPAEKHACIVHTEVYDPDETADPRPPHPDEVLGDKPDDSTTSRHWSQRYDAMEQSHYDYADTHGWDSDYERFERTRGIDYRCERCEGLAEAIEDLGYCMIAPGDLIDCHVEYVEEHGDGNVIWKRDRFNVWQPRNKSR